jgi:hypothetical protein
VSGENGDAGVGQDVPFELITQSHSLRGPKSPDGRFRPRG